MSFSRLNNLLLWQAKGNEDTRVLSLSGKDLSSFEERCKRPSVIANAADESSSAEIQTIQLLCVDLLDASHNRIKDLYGMMNITPSAWWVNLRRNVISSSSDLQELPKALGMLDLAHNPISADALLILAHAHILRLYMDVGGTVQKDRDTLCMCPNVWVLNDNYFSFRERAAMEISVADTEMWKSIERKFIGSGLLGIAERKTNAQLDTTVTVNLTGSADGERPSAYGAESIDEPHYINHASTPLHEPLAPMSIGANPFGSFNLSVVHNDKPQDGNYLNDDASVDSGVVPSAKPEKGTGADKSQTYKQPATRVATHIASNSEQHIASQENNHVPSELWTYRVPSEREGAFMGAMHTFRPTAAYSMDFYRLDVLLEDYLQEAYLANTSSPGIPYQGVRGNKYPVLDLLTLISLPRRLKMDVSVLLSIMIIIPVPKALLSDVLVRMLLPHMQPHEAKDLLALPSFVKSAVVALLRRVLNKEEEEIRKFQSGVDKRQLYAYRASLSKTKISQGPMALIPSFPGDSAEGWGFMFPVLCYLHSPVSELESLTHSLASTVLQSSKLKPGAAFGPAQSVPMSALTTVVGNTRNTHISPSGSSDPHGDMRGGSRGSIYSGVSGGTAANSSSGVSAANAPPQRFTVLEYQLIAILPDVVTPTTPFFDEYDTNESQWINVAARHAVLSLARSDLCPNLTKPQHTAKAQDAYIELLPLLTMARMTLADLSDTAEDEQHSGVVVGSYGRSNIFKSVSRAEAASLNTRVNGGAAGTFLTGVQVLDANELGSESVDTAPQPQHPQSSHPNAKDSEKLASLISNKPNRRHALVSGTELAFGAGLPRGGASGLTWRQEGKLFNHRDYDVWNDHKHTDRKELRKIQYEQLRINQARIESVQRGRGVSSPIARTDGPRTAASGHLRPHGYPLSFTVPTSIINDADGQSLGTMSVLSFGGEGEQEEPHAPSGAQVASSPQIPFPLDSNASREATFTDAMLTGEYDLGSLAAARTAPVVRGDESVGMLAASNHSAHEAILTANSSMVRGIYNELTSPVAGVLLPDGALPLPVLYRSPSGGMLYSPLGKVATSAVPTPLASPTRSVKIVNGFSANAAPESSFLLAPTAVVVAKNKIASPTEKLSMMHQAPVLVHPSTPKILPIPDDIKMGSSKMVSIPRGPTFPGMHSYGPYGGETVEDDMTFDASVSAASSSSDSTVHPAMSARNLLAEMGTLRNIRNLQIDDGTYCLPKITLSAGFAMRDRGGPGVGNGDGDSYPWAELKETEADYEYGNRGKGASSKFDHHHNHDQMHSNADMGGNRQNRGQNQGQGRTTHQTDAATKHAQRIREPAQTKIFQSQNINSILTAADLVKMKSNYKNVFTTANVPASMGYTNNATRNNGRIIGGQVGQHPGMRPADEAVGGRPLSSSWYPVPKKSTFTLAADSKDAIEAAIRALYGGEFSGEIARTGPKHGNNNSLPQHALQSQNPSKVAKSKHEVTYVTPKLRLKHNGDDLPKMMPHPAASDSSNRFSSNIYENNFAAATTRQFAQTATSKNAVDMYMNREVPVFNNLTHVQAAVKTSIAMSATNALEESSLAGTRENYALHPKLGKSKSFKLRGNSQPADLGIHLSMNSSAREQ